MTRFFCCFLFSFSSLVRLSFPSVLLVLFHLLFILLVCCACSSLLVLVFSLTSNKNFFSLRHVLAKRQKFFGGLRPPEPPARQPSAFVFIRSRSPPRNVCTPINQGSVNTSISLMTMKTMGNMAKHTSVLNDEMLHIHSFWSQKTPKC